MFGPVTAAFRPPVMDLKGIKVVLGRRTEADQVLEHGVLAQVSVLQLSDDVSLPGLLGPPAGSRCRRPAPPRGHSGRIRHDSAGVGCHSGHDAGSPESFMPRSEAHRAA